MAIYPRYHTKQMCPSLNILQLIMHLILNTCKKKKKNPVHLCLLTGLQQRQLKMGDKKQKKQRGGLCVPFMFELTHKVWFNLSVSSTLRLLRRRPTMSYFCTVSSCTASETLPWQQLLLLSCFRQLVFLCCVVDMEACFALWQTDRQTALHCCLFNGESQCLIAAEESSGAALPYVLLVE